MNNFRILTDHNSIACQFIGELRSAEIQQDTMRFRRNMERLGEIAAYEISKTFTYQPKEIKTPLGSLVQAYPQSAPVLAVVLRAGLPFYQGFLNYFDTAESAFIAAYRDVLSSDHSFKIKMEYLAAPSIENKVLILIDPMLATGQSLLQAYTSICRYGMPSAVHIVSVIASRAGASFIQKNIPSHTLWTVAMDDTLDHKSYIVPGLGDAGDLSFGRKL